MSPSWSADGQWLAYVSFEGKKSGVYVQRVRTGERAKVSQRAGINGAPAFSPDGKKLALTLGGTGGNPDIYVLDLSSQGLLRITDDPAIDTEAVWTLGRPVPVLHLRSRRRPADLPHRGAGGGQAEAHHLQWQLQRPPAREPGWHAARDGDARRQQLPHRRAEPDEQLGAGALEGPAGRVAELCAEWGHGHLFRAGGRARLARHRIDGWPDRTAFEGG